MSPCTPTVLQCTTRRTPARGGGLDEVATAVGVDGAIGRRSAGPACAVERGDVVDDLDAGDGGGQRAAVAEVA